MENVTSIRVGDLCRRKYENGTWSQQLFEVRNVVGNKVAAWMHYGEWSREVVLDATDLEPGEKAEWLPYAEWIRKDDAEIVDGCYIPNFVCSRCNDWLREETDFCPSCGAKMRKR